MLSMNRTRLLLHHHPHDGLTRWTAAGSSMLSESLLRSWLLSMAPRSVLRGGLVLFCLRGRGSPRASADRLALAISMASSMRRSTAASNLAAWLLTGWFSPLYLRALSHISWMSARQSCMPLYLPARSCREEGAQEGRRRMQARIKETTA